LTIDKESKKIAKEAHTLLLAEFQKVDKRIKQVTNQLKKMGHKTSNKRSSAQSVDTKVSKKMKMVRLYFHSEHERYLT